MFRACAPPLFSEKDAVEIIFHLPAALVMQLVLLVSIYKKIIKVNYKIRKCALTPFVEFAPLEKESFADRQPKQV